MSLPFPSLDFPERKILTVTNVAEKLHYTCEHIIGLIEEGTLVGIDGSAEKGSRMSHRIPIESYRDFIRKRMSGPFKETAFSKLTLTQLITLRDEITVAIAMKREVEKQQAELFQDA